MPRAQLHMHVQGDQRSPRDLQQESEAGHLSDENIEEQQRSMSALKEWQEEGRKEAVQFAEPWQQRKQQVRRRGRAIAAMYIISALQAQCTNYGGPQVQ